MTATATESHCLVRPAPTPIAMAAPVLVMEFTSKRPFVKLETKGALIVSGAPEQSTDYELVLVEDATARKSKTLAARAQSGETAYCPIVMIDRRLEGLFEGSDNVDFSLPTEHDSVMSLPYSWVVTADNRLNETHRPHVDVLPGRSRFLDRVRTAAKTFPFSRNLRKARAFINWSKSKEPSGSELHIFPIELGDAGISFPHLEYSELLRACSSDE